nr:unnamed protein product [Meloidogyne enterolobii]
MFGTQISAICSDQTGIENIKQERNWNNNGRRSIKPNTNEDIENCDNNNNKSSPAWKNLQVVFGGGGGQKFSFKWLNPFDVPFHSEKAFEFSV